MSRESWLLTSGWSGTGEPAGIGATADGAVGPNDPVHAIRDVLKDQQFDEIIISTLPVGASKWLRRDIPHRVERAFHLPVTWSLPVSRKTNA